MSKPLAPRDFRVFFDPVDGNTAGVPWGKPGKEWADVGYVTEGVPYTAEIQQVDMELFVGAGAIGTD